MCLNINKGFISTFTEHFREKPYSGITYNLTPYPLYSALTRGTAMLTRCPNVEGEWP